MIREALLALLVLGVTLLNFGHTTHAFAADGQVVAISSSFCGNPLIPADGDHTPCHACRVGQAADLPPPPAAIVPVAFVAVGLTYATPPLAIPAPRPFQRAAPRGPPVLV